MSRSPIFGTNGMPLLWQASIETRQRLRKSDSLPLAHSSLFCERLDVATDSCIGHDWSDVCSHLRDIRQHRNCARPANDWTCSERLAMPFKPSMSAQEIMAAPHLAAEAIGRTRVLTRGDSLAVARSVP